MKIFGAVLILFLLFSLDAFSQITRATTFDDRKTCEENKGVWREFGNGCVDSCNAKFDQFIICTYAITFGCDCGKSRCWNDKSCIAVADYKKIYDVEEAKEQKILAEAKSRRQAMSQQNQQAVLQDLLKKNENRMVKNAVAAVTNNYSNFYANSNSTINNAIDSAANAGNALSDQVTSSIPAVPTTPTITEAPPIIINNSPATVPPLFLQQEQSKQKQPQATPTAPLIQALPVVPLPH